MKTKLLSLFALLLLTQAAMAQFHLGVKAGTNITKVDGKSFKDEFRYGYHLGGFAEIRLGNKFVLEPEVLWLSLIHISAIPAVLQLHPGAEMPC